MVLLLGSQFVKSLNTNHRTVPSKISRGCPSRPFAYTNMIQNVFQHHFLHGCPVKQDVWLLKALKALLGYRLREGSYSWQYICWL